MCVSVSVSVCVCVCVCECVVYGTEVMNVQADLAGRFRRFGNRLIGSCGLDQLGTE